MSDQIILSLETRATNGLAGTDDIADRTDEAGAIGRGEYHYSVVPRSITGESEEYPSTAAERLRRRVSR